MNRREFLQLNAFIAAAPRVGIEADRQMSPARNIQTPGQSTHEELVSVVTEDGLVMSGLLVTPEGPRVHPVAIIWIHGAGENFYFPSYPNIARATALQGHAFITANTRMHDIGCVVSYRPNFPNRRGGSYWGFASKQPIDIAAWVEFASLRGYRRVVIVGHSAGGPAVRRYQVERNDPRVIGIVMASVGLGPAPPRADPSVLKLASQMVADGRGQELLSNPRISAATYVDYSQTPVDIWDFYGTETSTSNPAIGRLRCPLLVWFGSTDVGNAGDLERLKALLARHGGPSRVDTQVIEGADHNYTGRESEIARILTAWTKRLSP